MISKYPVNDFKKFCQKYFPAEDGQCQVQKYFHIDPKNRLVAE